MADRTVRAIFEARVSDAKKNIVGFGKDVADAGQKVDGLTKDLKTLDSAKVKPEIDVKIEDAKKRLTDLTRDLAELKAMEPSPEVDVKIEAAKAAIKDVRAEIKDLTGQKAEVRVEASIQDAQKRIRTLTLDLGELRTMKASPEVDVQIKDTRRKLADAKRELRELSGAKAEMKVTVDTSQAKDALGDLGDEGEAAGDEAGAGVVSGILDALRSIPIAGAVVGVGAAIAGGILLGIKQGMQIEADRDIFGARTGLDEATAAKFGRAAGEAYANVFGDSVAANLETARTALEQGLIDPKATEADARQIIESLSGISQIMQTDIPETARAAGQMIKTGLADSAERAFDILVAGYQHGAGASADLMDTLEEYPVLFQRLGLSGEDAMGLLIQGLKGGAFNADKTADALKEFQIRATDASESSAKGFELIGLNAAEMTARIAKGGPEARAGLQEVLDGLNAIEDPVKRNTAGVALFGTQWEDMGDAIRKLDLKTAASEIGDAAGATERALKTMSDNAASQIEGARRNIEEAANGIKGALAAAFADDIEGAAKWVQANRAPIMQFFVDVINGTINAGKAFVEFSAQSLDGIAALADGLANVLQFIPGMTDAAAALRTFADSAHVGAETLRTEVPAALDETRDKINAWAGPELLKARIHDATVAMSADMDDFSEKVNASGGTVTINGDTLTAEQALAVLTQNIDGSDGTVTINGDRVPADQALNAVLESIRAGRANVTVGANTAAAEAAISNLVRYRVAEIGVRIAGITGQGGQVIGNHDGGWIQKGRHLGGWVPGSDPGYDNILWPLNSGGRTLQQPLAGGEMVVNSKDAAFWAPVLEWMNGGGRPSSSSYSAGLDPATIRAALDGSRLELTGVDKITGHMSARLVGAIGRV